MPAAAARLRAVVYLALLKFFLPWSTQLRSPFPYKQGWYNLLLRARPVERKEEEEEKKDRNGRKEGKRWQQLGSHLLSSVWA